MFVTRSWPLFHIAGRNLASNAYELVNGVGSNSLPQPYHENSYPLAPGASQYLKTGHGSLLKVVKSNFCSNQLYSVREIYPQENETAHNLLCSMPEYRNTTLHNFQLTSTDPGRPPENTLENNSTEPFSESLNKFKWVANNIDNCHFTLEQNQFEGILECVKENVYDYSFLQVSEMLKATAKLNNHMPNNVALSKFINTIDNFCAGRIQRRWTLSSALYIADHWYYIGISKNSQFIDRMLKNFTNLVKFFNKNNFVQYMFIANLVRNIGPTNPIILNKLYANFIDDLSLEEITIVSQAFFKTLTHIDNKILIKKINKKISYDKEIMSDECLSEILKSFRKSTITCNQITNLINNLCPLLHSRSSHVWVNLLQIASQSLCYVEQFLHLAQNLFLRDLRSLRLKDIERCVHAFVTLSYNNHIPHLFHFVIEELRRPERMVEINHFPHVFVSCICSLGIISIYPLDLVSAVFQPTMHKIIQCEEYGEHYKNPLRSTNELSWSMLIEGPADYKGHQLNPVERMSVTEKYMGRIPTSGMTLTDQEIFTLKSKDILNYILNPIEASVQIILPYFILPDLVFCTNMDGQPVNIPEEYMNQPITQVKNPVYQDLKWNVIILAGRNLVLKPDRVVYKGSVYQKSRHLMSLGYIVTVLDNDKSLRKIKQISKLVERLSQTSSLNCENVEDRAINTFLKNNENRTASVL